MDKLKIGFVGDIMLGRDFDMGSELNKNTFIEKLEHMIKNNFNKDSLKTVYGTTLDLLNSYDLVIGNLETAITYSEEKDEKMFNYRILPKYANGLKINQNMFLNIANNHILDYKEQGLVDTINSLNSVGIKFSGAGINLEEATKPAIFKIKDVTIGILGVADHYDRWASDINKHGINFVDYNNYDGLLNHLKNIKQVVDILILSIHWGSNYARGIQSKYRKFAHDVLGSGADIIHGQSSHHVKCITKNLRSGVKTIKNYKDSLVIYGIGDFVNDYAIDPEFKNNLGMIVEVGINNLHPLNLDVNVIPTKIKDKTVNIATDNKNIEYVLDQIKSDCNYLHTGLSSLNVTL